MMPGMADTQNYFALIKWAYAQSQYNWNTKSLETTLQAFMDNVDRLRSISLMPAVVAAHAAGKGNEPGGLMLGSATTEALSASPMRVVRHGLQNLFAHVIVGAWTAFESLATDLWIDCVN